MTATRDDFEAHFKPTIRQQKRHTDGSYRDPLTQARWEGYQAAQGEIARLTACLAGANAQAEEFERRYYLETHKVEDLQEQLAALKAG